MIKHIAEVDPETGNIEYLYLSQPVNPPEGPNTNTGFNVVYIYEEIDQMDFIEHKYYDVYTSTWIERPSRPNPFAFWTGSTWDWDDENLLNYIRNLRNEKLRETDWTQVDDNSLTGQERVEAAQYRQSLRDLTEPLKQAPENFPTLDSVSWPTPPVFLT